MATVSMKPAATGMYKHTYKPLSVCSLDFGEFMCSRIVEVEKSDQWNFEECKGTLRIAPSKFPTYGKNSLRTAAFFVPSSQLVQYYDQIRNNNQLWRGKPVRVVKFHAYQINEMFYNRRHNQGVPALCYVRLATNQFNLSAAKIAGHVDFLYYDKNEPNDPFKYCYLTSLGKVYYKVFKMLGYDFASYNDVGSYSDPDAIIATASEFVNAFPLLAFLKVYTDYFLEPQFYNTDPLVNFLQHIHDDEDLSLGDWVYTQGIIATSALFAALDSVCVPFEKNMYLDAWNAPNSPTGVSPSQKLITTLGQGSLSPFIPSPDYKNTVSQTYDTATTVEADSDASTLRTIVTSNGATILSGLSQLGLNALLSVYKFVRRNNLVGSKPLEQLLSRFGIKASDWYAHFAHKLYEGISEIDYSAVVSQSDTYSTGSNDGKSLGAFAGYGASGLNFSFKYKASDPGYIIILHWLQITPINKHGFDPMTLRVSPMDWFTPEFDGKTIRAIPQMEVSVDRGSGLSFSGDRKIFGFTDIYEEYRSMRDSVVGDFVTDSNGVNDFYFGRDLSYYREVNDGQSTFKPKMQQILYMGRTGLRGDMTEPFQDSVVNGDRFYLYMRYSISAKRQIKSKVEALDLNGEGDQETQLGGSQLS